MSCTIFSLFNKGNPEQTERGKNQPGRRDGSSRRKPFIPNCKTLRTRLLKALDEPNMHLTFSSFAAYLHLSLNDGRFRFLAAGQCTDSLSSVVHLFHARNGKTGNILASPDPRCTNSRFGRAGHRKARRCRMGRRRISPPSL